ncbi:MAG: diguanylate cyclase, partial [Alphaproteobacteria bacterium]|nr:diguanylate cyclase [Alphaproteobacteria bacterium]
EDALALRERIVAAEWVDGNVTSGSGAATVKRNRQLPEDAPITQAAQAEVTSALMDNAAFLSAALPHSVFPPLFNRYGGGEEFGLLIAEGGGGALAQIAERARREIGALSLDWNGQTVTVTASFGTALRRDGDTPNSLYERADHALRAAKEGGRNRVEAAAD